MKKLYKEYTLTAGGGTLTFKANSLNDYYLINGGAVTLTSGLTIAVDAATKNNVVRIYWLQDTTIGGGGSITILGNNVPINIIGGIMFTCVYNGTTWDIFQTPAEDYDAATIELANVAYVNPDITTDDTKKRVFSTVGAAQDYIINTAGTATTNNHWTIKVSSGYIDEAITLKAYIDVQLSLGTKVKSVTSNVPFVSSNVYDSVVYDGYVETAYVAEAKTANFVRCKIGSITPVLGAAAGQLLLTDCTIKSADFSNSESIFDWSGNKFYATDGNILMSGITHNVKDSEIVAYSGNNISLPDSMINCFIGIPTITTTRATSIAGGKVVATTINAGADLSLLNTDIGAANLTMATGTNLVRNATKSSGTITLDGTATKADLDNVWNDGVATDISATAWNGSTANGSTSTALNNAVSNGNNSLAAVDSISNGNYSAAFSGSTTDGEYSFAACHGTTNDNFGVALNYGVTNSENSTAIGKASQTYSYGEIAIGAYNTSYVPTSTTTWEDADRLFVIGNGVSGAESDALIILKSGEASFLNQVNIGTILHLEPQDALPVSGMKKGDIVVLTTGVIYFYNGTDWGSFDITVS